MRGLILKLSCVIFWAVKRTKWVWLEKSCMKHCITTTCLSEELGPLGSPQWLGIGVHGHEPHFATEFHWLFLQVEEFWHSRSLSSLMFQTMISLFPHLLSQSCPLPYFWFSSWISLSQTFLDSDPLLPPSLLCFVPALCPYVEISSNSIPVSL